MVLISGVRHLTNNCFTNRLDSFILAAMEEQTTEKQLPDSVELLKTLLLSAQKQLKEKDRKIHSLHSLINAYQEEKRLAQAHRFGASSEKDSPQQRLFDEAEVGADTLDEADEKIVTPVKSHQRRGGRNKLPANLPRVEVIHDLSDDEKQCTCGCAKEKIGEEVSEQLDIIPAKVSVIRHIRYKYNCQQCDTPPSTAPMPPQPIPKSQASPGFLAYVVTSKYADALPLYRQCNILKRSGIEYARNTLCHQVVKAGLSKRELNI